jgi:hypothetical protein
MMSRDRNPTQASQSPATAMAMAMAMAMATARASRACNPITANAVELHRLMACASLEAIEQLLNNVLGVSQVDGRAPRTHEYGMCGLAKMKQHISESTKEDLVVKILILPREEPDDDYV